MPRVVASISRILTPGASSILTAAEKPSDTFQSLLLVDYWLFEKWEYRPPPLVQQPRCLHAPIIIDIPRRSPLHLSFPPPPPLHLHIPAVLSSFHTFFLSETSRSLLVCTNHTFLSTTLRPTTTNQRSSIHGSHLRHQHSPLSPPSPTCL